MESAIFGIGVIAGTEVVEHVQVSMVVYCIKKDFTNNYALHTRSRNVQLCILGLLGCLYLADITTLFNGFHFPL